MRNTKKGFTLVELLVVIAILAILATVSVVGYTSFINNANNSVAQQELTQIRDYVIAQEYLGGVTVNQALVAELGLEGTLEEGKIDDKTCYRYTLDKGVAYWLTEKNEVKVDLTGWTAAEGGTTGGETPVDPDPETPVDPDPETPAEPTTVTKTHTEIATLANVQISAGNNTYSISGKALSFDDNITVQFDKGSSSTNPSVWADEVRLYQSGGKLTITANDNVEMTTIVITYTETKNGNNNLTVTGGTLAVDTTNKTLTITVNDGATSVEITTGGSAQADRLYVASIEIGYNK